MTTAIGIDLGGTRIKGAVIDASGQLLRHSYIPTNDGEGARWKGAVAELIDQLMKAQGIEPAVIGISAPGLPAENNRSIACMPGRMQGLEGFNWSEYLGRDVYVLNDAIAALVAEARSGAATSHRHVVMLTLGTGVGGAILIDGKPYQGAFNKAGHIGHMVINDEDDRDVAGMPGSLEESIGNYTVMKRSKGRFTSTRELLAAYRDGDAQARDVWIRSVRRLGIALASITNILSPEIIVLGGGIIEAGDDLMTPLKMFMAEYEWRAGGNKVTIVKAKHGDLAGAIGAGSFALQKKFL